MFVKQITMDEALKLAAKGQEIMTLVPSDVENNWSEMTPDTLQNMLSGVMFFRGEPALIKTEFGGCHEKGIELRTDK